MDGTARRRNACVRNRAPARLSHPIGGLPVPSSMRDRNGIKLLASEGQRSYRVPGTIWLETQTGRAARWTDHMDQALSCSLRAVKPSAR